jgi:hypothetical protein
LISGPGNQQQASFSPDGRWVVYASAESGQPEIYVQSFPPGTKYQITTTGGMSPLWSPDGKQIFYLDVMGGLARQLRSVDVHTQPSLGFGNPTKLPIDKIASRNGMVRSYDITPDGKQFLAAIRDAPDSDPSTQPQMRIALNWFEELKQRVR